MNLFFIVHPVLSEQKTKSSIVEQIFEIRILNIVTFLYLSVQESTQKDSFAEDCRFFFVFVKIIINNMS